MTKCLMNMYEYMNYDLIKWSLYYALLDNKIHKAFHVPS